MHDCILPAVMSSLSLVLVMTSWSTSHKGLSLCWPMQWDMQPTGTPRLAEQRYAAYMDDIQPGVRRYNVFWQPFESSGMLPSTQPLSCPAGYQLASLQFGKRRVPPH